MRVRQIFAILTGCVILLGGALTVQAGEPHPFNVHDLVTMQRIGDPQVSPDGKQIVFVLRTTDMDANRGRNDLWMVNTDGSGMKRLTSHPAADFNPRWSPCGKRIWFLSTRSGSVQIWHISPAGGEAIQFSNLPLDVGNLIVSPYGEFLSFTADVFPEKGCVADTQKKLKAREDDPATGMIYDRLFFRHWDTWKDGRRSHLFVMPVKGGKPLNLMKGMDADTPSKPFGGAEEIAFAPDNQGLVFTARVAGHEEAWSTNFDLFFVPIDGSLEPLNLTEANPAWDTQPLFSPDGKTMAYLAMKKPGYESDRFRIVLRSWVDGKERVLTEAWDHSPSSMAWSANSKVLYVSAPHLGQNPLFAIDVKSGRVTTIVEKGHVSSFAPAGKRVLFGLDNLKSPVELYTIKPNGSDRKAITSVNAGKLADIRMGDYEQFTFRGWNEETVYCYVVKPSDFQAGRKYPVAFLIHGGPQGSFGNRFHYRWNPQTYAGAGYACVMVDFHGSVGYGQDFCDAIRGDWGGKPLVDLQKGLKAALARYPWLDGERVGALGASFGGYMINWIAGAWPDRFKCLVCHDGNLDERLAYFDTEELWFPEWDHMGTPWTNPEGYEKHNPVNLVERWQTPMLIIHGALDYRVVETQGLSSFTACQRRGVPSRLLYFPDENHWVLKPHNSILWHDTVLGWMDEWLK
jgi:dipeptidyl aminopeptidase/acylaminoacyl peptidase